MQTDMERQVVTIENVTTNPRSLKINWDDGDNSEFHYFWLRDNCRCPDCWHPQAEERLLDTIAIPPDITPTTVRKDDEGDLVIVWDEHESIYDPVWLHQHSYSAREKAKSGASLKLWDASLATSLPEVSYESIMSGQTGLLKWLKLISEYGFAIVHGAPAKPGEVANVAQLIADLRETNYEIVYDVRSMPDPNSIAYTAVELKPHTDLSNRYSSGVIQFLHCIESTAIGGDSILVDGFYAAQEFRRHDPDGFSLLTSTPLPFRFRDKMTDIHCKAPIISLDLDGNLFQVRYNNALLAPIDAASELVESIYASYRNFTLLIRDPALQVRLRLEPGDVMAFNNLRVMHGRGSFDPQSGRRHLQGCYVDVEDFRGRLTVMEQQLAN